MNRTHVYTQTHTIHKYIHTHICMTGSRTHIYTYPLIHTRDTHIHSYTQTIHTYTHTHILMTGSGVRGTVWGRQKYNFPSYRALLWAFEWTSVLTRCMCPRFASCLAAPRRGSCGESCHACEWVVSLAVMRRCASWLIRANVWVSHAPRRGSCGKSCHVCKWVVLHAFMRFVLCHDSFVHMCEWAKPTCTALWLL